MPSAATSVGKGETTLACTGLGSARAEQAWITERLGEGIGRPQMALVRYGTPAVIYGRRGHGDADPDVPERARQSGHDLLRRRSGGGAVLAGPWLLGVDLLLPAAHPLSAAGHIASFRWLGSVWHKSLRTLGVFVEIADAASIAESNAAACEAGLDWVCFAGLSHGELIDVQGRKLLGLAQWRGRWGTLLSAGLLVAQTPWETLEFVHLGQRPKRSRMHRQASPGLATVAPEVTVERVCRSLAHCLNQNLRCTDPPFVAQRDEIDGRGLLATHY